MKTNFGGDITLMHLQVSSKTLLGSKIFRKSSWMYVNPVRSGLLIW